MGTNLRNSADCLCRTFLFGQQWCCGSYSSYRYEIRFLKWSTSFWNCWFTIFSIVFVWWFFYRIRSFMKCEPIFDLRIIGSLFLKDLVAPIERSLNQFCCYHLHFPFFFMTCMRHNACAVDFRPKVLLGVEFSMSEKNNSASGINKIWECPPYNTGTP